MIQIKTLESKLIKQEQKTKKWKAWHKSMVKLATEVDADLHAKTAQIIQLTQINVSYQSSVKDLMSNRKQTIAALKSRHKEEVHSLTELNAHLSNQIVHLKKQTPARTH